MILGAPWGLLALLAIPAVVAIHLFRRRYRPRPVSGLFLYGLAPLAPASGRRKQRLLWHRSLLLELLAVLAATWFLTDPHLGDRESADHFIAVLDDRARMQAALPGGQATYEAARDALDAQLAALDRDDRVTLVLTGAPARILVGPEARPTEARSALARWRPEAAYHEPDDALGLALDLASDQGALGATVRFVGDRRPSGLPETVGLLTRGAPRPTSGLADARWLAADGARPERVALRVVAHGGLPRHRDVVVTAGDRELARARAALTPAAATGLTLPLPAGAPAEIEVALVGDDPLQLDDRVTLVRPSPREVTVSVALAADQAGPVQRALRAVDGVRAAAAGEVAHLTITEASAPPPRDRADASWRLSLAPAAGQLAVGPFLTARGHPALRGVDLTGVVWAGAAPASAADPDAQGLLLAGDSILATESLRGRARDLTLHLDLARSTVADHPAWPALMSNLVEARRAALPGPSRTNLPLGQATAVTLPAGARTLTLEAPSGDATELAADRYGVVLLPPLTEPGPHDLRLEAAPADARGWSRINGLLIDARLGDLLAAERLDEAPAEAAGAEVARRRGAAEHTLPLVIAALAALAAWWSFRREERLANPASRDDTPATPGRLASSHRGGV